MTIITHNFYIDRIQILLQNLYLNNLEIQPLLKTLLFHIYKIKC